MASHLESFSKWLKLKIHQFEVTLSVNLYTPDERFIFYSVLFLLVSLTFIATVLYLPQHVQFVISRAWFYMHGDGYESAAGGLAKGVVNSAVGTTTAAAAAVERTAEAVREL
ncbi:2c32f542-c921-4676-8329-a18271153da7 [Thermothielavioides terrestris]|uniref:Uncharacterized protein n=2 Tax=Thermothielavioides terrestris TaxID=2587410 RepID=G2QS26_THETT|nr:uncharacterized protein THITE_2108640 [Thermothielavioides terrestris NRRL 8126]AEO63416.1 hypothetical protein THITE_2108640 [Thermothielavioides terrestris NRRL 8126]SPQ21083.1 2c32f542-c921-4676-8329-a18271153da7 [Thermothielavioides terrestris]